MPSKRPYQRILSRLNKEKYSPYSPNCGQTLMYRAFDRNLVRLVSGWTKPKITFSDFSMNRRRGAGTI